MKQTHEWDQMSLLSMPLMAPMHDIISRLESEHFPIRQELNGLLETYQPTITVHSGRQLCFVPHEIKSLHFEEQYEPRCYLKGEVLTRDSNWHDLFNALVWLTFPKSKARVNLRHYQEIKGDVDTDTHGRRGAVRDMNTLLDESGVIVPYTDDKLAELLREFKWKELFWHRRADVQTTMGFYLFGHGLYEKALQPYIGMTGQGLLLPVVKEFFIWPMDKRLRYWDKQLAGYLSLPEHCHSTRELTPVPLLRVPGWSDENTQEKYYDNKDYFRPVRHNRAQFNPLNTAPSSVAG